MELKVNQNAILVKLRATPNVVRIILYYENFELEIAELVLSLHYLCDINCVLFVRKRF